jgi:hypothetical protein
MKTFLQLTWLRRRLQKESVWTVDLEASLVVRGPLTRQEQDTGEPQGQTRAMRRSHGGIHRRGSGPKSAGGDAGREEGQNENGVENMAQIRDAAFGAETQSSPSGASRTSGSSRRDPSPIGQASQPRLRPHWPVFWAGVKALARRPRHHHPQPSASLAPLLWACCRDARAPAAAPPYLRTRSPQRRIPNRRRGDTIVVSRVASGAVTASRSSGFRGGTKVDPYCALHDRLRVAVTSQPCFALIWV